MLIVVAFALAVASIVIGIIAIRRPTSNEFSTGLGIGLLGIGFRLLPSLCWGGSSERRRTAAERMMP